MKETFYLLIDDDAIVNNMHSILFQMAGIDRNVFVFESAEQALDFIMYTSDKGKYNYMIFLDINMPMMDGWEFLEELEAENQNSKQQVKVVMVTSSIDPTDKEKAKTYPSVIDYISKPLRKEQVRELQSQFIKRNPTIN